MTNNPATSHTTHSGEHRAPDLLPSVRGPYEHDEPHGAPWAGRWIDDEIEKAKGMNMTDTVKITIIDKTRRSRIVGWMLLFFLPISLIGIGIAADSGAMQWMGFVVTIFAVISVSTTVGKKNNELTIDQARKRLDEIEQGH